MEERLKAEAESKRKAEEERLKAEAEAEAKKAEEKKEEKMTGSGDGLATNAVKRANPHIEDEALSAPTGPISNSIFGSIINSFCSFFRSARVSFDTKPNKNVLIFRGQNIITKMMIMFVLEAAERYDRNVAIAAAKALGNDDVDADAVADLVLCSKLAFDAAFQLKFLFYYEEHIVEHDPLSVSGLTLLDLKYLIGRKASRALYFSQKIHELSESFLKTKTKTKTETETKIIELTNCAYLATMAARIVAYCCALRNLGIKLLVSDPSTLLARLDGYDNCLKYKPNPLGGYYLDINLTKPDSDSDSIITNKTDVKTSTMELLNMGLARDHLFTTAIDRVEAIVASENSEAAKKDLDLISALPELEKYLSNAKKRVQFTQNEVEFYGGGRIMAGAGKSRRKSRKNVKKNTRRNKKFRMSSKTKKQRRGYSRRRRSYSRKNGRQ